MSKNETLRAEVVRGVQNYETYESIGDKNGCSKQNIGRLVKDLFRPETLKKLKAEKKELCDKKKELNRI
jgi:uncharacterized protein YerC